MNTIVDGVNVISSVSALPRIESTETVIFITPHIVTDTDGYQAREGLLKSQKVFDEQVLKGKPALGIKD